MSIINNLLEKLTGLDLDGSDTPQKQTVERPCANCPSDCAIAGEACTICEPYKKKLIDWVYHVDHLDEFRAQYEVVTQAQAAASGTTHCPRCGANSSDPYICEYCGSQLAEKPASSGKIQVSAASEIPNPIMQAQDVIYARYEAVLKKSQQDKSSSSSSGSFLSNLFAEFLGSETTEEEISLGGKMSESEITEAASLYGVTVGTYLTGLDNGKYLTLSAKKEADAQGASSTAPATAGLAGMAGIGMLAGGLLSNSGYNRRRDDFLRRPSQPSQPQRQPQQSSSRYEDRVQRPQQQSGKREENVKPNQAVSRDTRRDETPSRPSTVQKRDDGNSRPVTRRDDPPSRPSYDNNTNVSKRIDSPARPSANNGNSGSSRRIDSPTRPSSNNSNSGTARRIDSPSRPNQSSGSSSGSGNWKDRNPGARRDNSGGRGR